MDFDKLKKDTWLKIWAGNWSVLTCSYWGHMYTHSLQINGRLFLDQTILITHKGKSAGYALESARQRFGTHLADEVKDNPVRVQIICNNLKMEVNRILSFIETYQDKEINFDQYREFWNIHAEYYIPHVNVKYVVDYLEPELLEKFLSHFEEARLYAEPVFKRTEEFIVGLGKIISEKINLPPYLVLCCVKEEIEDFFVNNIFPDKTILEKRWSDSAFYFDQTDKYEFFIGEDVKEIESALGQTGNVSSLKGVTAYKGLIKGEVKIIFDPGNANHFNDGDILVTGMTRPEFLPLMKRAGAFITDSGGILSHAAIVARELRKPCLIGTERATQIFKDGDMVEVDANQGIIRKI